MIATFVATNSRWILGNPVTALVASVGMIALAMTPQVQAEVEASGPAVEAQSAPAAPPGVPVPPDYVIGPEDVLQIVYWREKDVSADVTVRPDGKISLPLLNDIQAAGLTPMQLHDRLIDASRRFIENPNVTVVVQEIKSRKVFITGQVENSGSYALTAPMTVIQLIALAGGLREYANAQKIVIVRTENGRSVTHRFNYKDVLARKSLQQNIELKPGDTVLVP